MSFGIDHSKGTVPDNLAAMASIAAKVLTAIKVDVADLILAGTQSGIGDGVVLPPCEILESAGANNDQAQTKENMMYLFYHPSDSSQKLGDLWGDRIHERGKDSKERRGYLTGAGAKAQLNAIFTFSVNDSNFDCLKDIKAPTLVTNGHRDIMSPTPNSFVLPQEIANAHLILYPDAGHGHLFQVPELYAKHVELFLADD
ncbi:2-hydroxy-6-oxononadienedioate/2-hydroxy-6-oxononatrienedioate hydrolase [Stagonosporopsis vannaccii]|nr:2-hydroxy-6-oxononadienedioate/2-hydroxy-6-oxononatrienedioate hydrolase [Stagonosporopsis vannaccii]